jgi:hypothetical protein
MESLILNEIDSLPRVVGGKHFWPNIERPIVGDHNGEIFEEEKLERETNSVKCGPRKQKSIVICGKRYSLL